MNSLPGREVVAQQAVSPPSPTSPSTSPSTSPAAGAAGFAGPLIHANEVRHRRALAGRGLLGTPRVAKLTNTLQESLPPLARLPSSQQPHHLTETCRRDLERHAALLRARPSARTRRSSETACSRRQDPSAAWRGGESGLAVAICLHTEADFSGADFCSSASKTESA